MNEFLGEFSIETGVNRLRQLADGPTLVVVPTNEIKDKLRAEIVSPKLKILRDFEAALTFFEGVYPIALVRELLCLRIIRTKQGLQNTKELFPLREPGISEARTLLKLFDELFLLGQSASFIANELKRTIHPEAERWARLLALEELYLSELSKEGFNFELSKRNTKVILFGLLKLSPLLKKVISSSDTTALVFTDAKNASSFNQLGEIVGELPISPLTPNEFVQTPRDYSKSINHLLNDSNSGIVLFDEIEKRAISQQLKENGYTLEEVENAQLRLVSSLVSAAIEAIKSERLFDLYSMLRITAVEDFIAKNLSILPEHGILSVVDEYQEDRLQLKWSAKELPEGKNYLVVLEILTALKEAFIFPLLKVKNLEDASNTLQVWIETFYPTNLELLTQLKELSILLPKDKLNVDEAFRMIINYLTAHSSKKIKAGALKLYDSLSSAYFGENRQLILLGPVSGRIPKGKSGSIFLNSGILKSLGLQEDEKLLQKCLLSILSSRIKAVVIPRLSLSGEPVSISPLFYPSEPEEIAKEVLRFYDDSETQITNPNTRTDIVRPLPLRDLTPIRNKDGVIQLSATALEFYSLSPFKFYVERVLQACSLSDERRELAPNQFGDLAHLVLKSVLKLNTESTLEEIQLNFGNELERLSAKIYGHNLSAAIETQFQNLRERLDAYAKYELKSLREGWKTIFSEYNSRPFTLITQKEPILLTARVDRIDFNDQLRTYRIWDYKTGDNIKNVFKKDESLSALQLPLYALFLKQGLFGEFIPDAKIEVGYIALGSKVSEPVAYEMTQRSLDEAQVLATQAGENLINCRFELGESERVSSSTAFSMYLDYHAVDFEQGEVVGE